MRSQKPASAGGWEAEVPAADLPSDFWAGWVALLTVASLVGLGWLVYSVYFSDKAAEQAEDHQDEPVWDGNLREGAQPPPLWWFWLLFGSLAVSVLYLMLYPGLGSYAGALQWSQGGRLDESMAEFEAEFGGTRRLVAEASLPTLQANNALMASAQRIYDRNCAACHGYDAQGQAQLFPDLTDAEWQWGGSPADIEHSIRQGRQAAMVGWLPVLGETGVQNLVQYTQLLQQGGADGHPAKAQYQQFCAACHGADGGGNPVLGAPSLKDEVTLYGDGPDAIEASIAFGRNGLMPPFGNRLDDTQVRLLVALLTPETMQSGS